MRIFSILNTPSLIDLKLFHSSEVLEHEVELHASTYIFVSTCERARAIVWDYDSIIAAEKITPKT